MVIFMTHDETWLYNEILLDHKYDKYLGAFGLVLVSMNNGQLGHCLRALKQITKVVWEQLRRTMQMTAFRLNEYENCG